MDSSIILLLIWPSIFGFSLSYQVKPNNFSEILRNEREKIHYLKNEFMQEYSKYQVSGVKSSKLVGIFKSLKVDDDIRYSNKLEDLSFAKQNKMCTVCQLGATVLIKMRREQHADRETLAQVTIKMCTDFKIQNQKVCQGLTLLNIDILLHIVDNRPNLDASKFCGVVLQTETCAFDDSEFQWEIQIDQNGKPITQSKEASKPDSKKDLKIVHITDFHFDSLYQVGANAECGEPCCCRNEHGFPENIENAAGKWGDYRHCDAPWIAVVDAVDHVLSKHSDADYIYYTGDIVDHAIWSTSIKHNLASMNKTYDLMLKKFKYIPVFPVLGNHESHPFNSFSPQHVNEDISTRWLYTYSANVWNAWLPAHTMETIRKAGYYTTLVHKGFRIIGLNNNDCYTFNWWILYDAQYSSQQLQWLHDTLLKAERDREKVHILAHVPSGEKSCFKTWGRQYRRIIDRFWNTVVAQFNGHTHRDEFNIYYSLDNPQYAINVAFNGGSTVPFSFVNPNYHVVYVDSSSYEVNNFESWSYNLTKSNLKPENKPRWFKLYEFKKEFSVKDLSPSSLNDLINRFAKDESLMTKYWEYKVKKGDPFLEKGCDKECLFKQLCEIVTTEAGDYRKCEELRKIFDENNKDLL